MTGVDNKAVDHSKMIGDYDTPGAKNRQPEPGFPLGKLYYHLQPMGMETQ